MDKSKNNLQIFLPRSSSAAIRDGYRLFMGNFRKIFRASWIAALAYAITAGILTSIYISQMPQLVILSIMGQSAPQQMIMQSAFISLVLCGGGLLFAMIVAVLLSYAIAAFTEHQATGAISPVKRWYGQLNTNALWSTVKLLLWMLLIDIVLSLLLTGVIFVAKRYLGNIAGLSLIGLTTLALLALMLPLAYTNMKYLLTPKAHFVPTQLKSYATGMRHWGGLFIVALIVGLVTLLLVLITELPATILMAANVQSQMGMLQGDPVGMPSYMSVLNLVVFAIAGFIQAYIHLSMLFPLYYFYGSIEAQEKERKAPTLIHDDL